jgi:hypothetical protein
METIILTAIVVALIIAAMAVGAIFRGKPISGSCGGLAAIGIDGKCDICGGNPAKCEEEQERVAEESAAKKNAMTKKATFYDAS